MSGPQERTLVMTDIEGSTLLWEREAAMGTALARHDDLVSVAVGNAGGRLVRHKGEGDSTFSIFDDPDAAVTAAIALQLAIAAEPWPTSMPISVRIGIDTGTVEERDGDYYGRAPNRAARVRGLGTGGTIVLTAATADRLADSLPDGARLVDLGEHALRGVDGLVGLVAVAHRNLPDPDTALSHLRFRAAPPVPAGLRFDAHAPLVGRRRELELLSGAWTDATQGRSTVALVAGEPGIGKSRLLAALAERVAADGGLILHGRCEEEALRPYQPFAEAVADATLRLSPDEILRLSGPSSADLAVVVPELRRRIRIEEPASSERFVVFEAVAAFLGELASERPVLLVAEDLHWGDEPTLALFRHLATRLTGRQVLLTASYRDTDADADEAAGLVRTLVAVRRTAATLDLRVEGLARDDVAQLLGRAHGDRLDEVWAASDGNPFLVVELRTSLADGRVGVPTNVRQSVGHRVDGLPADSRRLVSVSAVGGEEVDVETIALAADVGPDAVRPAIARGLVGEVPETPGRLRFVHALVREAILDRLTALERRDLHGRVARAIEERHRADLEPHAARLAHHHRQAGDLSAGGSAYVWSMRAGHWAGRSLAYEEAEREFRAAATIADGAGDVAGRIVAELELADVLVRSGRPTEGRQAARGAEAAATAAGEPELRAWAVFSTGFGQAVGLPETVAATEAALRGLEPASRWRVPLEVNLAAELMQAGDVDAGIAMLDECVDRARNAGDAVMHGVALTGRHMYVDRIETPAARILEVLAGAQEGTVPSLRLAPAVLRVQTEALRIGELVARGDVAGARQVADEFATKYGEESGTLEANVPFFRVADAALRGDWSSWRRLVGELRADAEWATAYEAQLMGCELIAAWLRGRLVELTPVIEGLPASMMLVRPALAFAYADGDRPDAARGVIDACAMGGGFEARARTVVGRSELAVIAYAVARSDDQEHAAQLLPLVEPRCGQIATWAGWGFWGAFDHLAGLLAATCGCHDDAVAHFRAALDLYERSGWRALSASAAAELAAVLAGRGGRGDGDEAARLGTQARAEAEDLGLAPVLRRLSTVDLP